MTVVEEPESTHPSEQALWDAVEAERPLDLLNDPEDALPADPADWGPRHSIRAEVLREVILSGKARRAIRLRGVHIEGSLDLEAASIAVPLHFETCLFDDFVDLSEAHIPSLSIRYSVLPLLITHQARIAGSLRLSGSTFSWINLMGAHVGGTVVLTGATVQGNDDSAIDADGMQIGQDLLARDGFAVAGEVRLVGASIGGQLVLDEARLENRGQHALSGDNIVARQGVFMNDATVVGQVRLHGAHIQGPLEMNGAKLEHEGDTALVLESATIDGSVSCCDGFSAIGTVQFVGAKFGSQLSFVGARLSCDGGEALLGERAVVEGSLLCRSTEVTGHVQLNSAHVRGQVVFAESGLVGEANERVLTLQEARIDGSLWLSMKHVSGTVDLTGTHIGTFVDRRTSWPKQIVLDRCVYEELVGEPPIDVKGRLEWLERSGEFAPQPYEQLMSVYRRAGHEDAMRTVGMAKERQRREGRSRRARLWGWFLRWTVGYGYEPWRAGAWLLGLFATGWIAFRALLGDHIEPARTARGLTLPDFHASIYTLDLLIPFVNLHQRDNWVAQDAAQYLAVSLTLAGWVLATVALGALTGLLKRD